MEKEIKNILIVSSQSINKNKYFYSLLKLKNVIYEKSFYDYNPLLVYKLIYNNILYVFNINLISISQITPKIEYEGIIELYDSFDSFEFIENFEESFHKEYGLKNFPTVRINLSREIKNESIYPIMCIENEIITDIKWNEILEKLIHEFKKEEMDQYPYNQIITYKNDNVNHNSNEYFQNNIENKKISYKSLIIFIFMFISAFSNLYVLLFVSEYNNIKHIYDGVFANMKTLILIIYFYTSFVGLKITLKKRKNKKDEIYQFKKNLRISLIGEIIIILMEIYYLRKYSYIINRNKSYVIYQICFDIILIIFCFVLICFKNI